ncbi:unnamed protein product [Enterobius vermicularis]|uniref:Uncharacterized protein n=1 Tax=Enterobius vermicularis TaxID=51028 RepID=A0A0N4V0L6_ENTVE|nr:unnamed protein product [Enterobius vermicularis]
MKGLSNGNGKRGPQHMHFIVGHGRLEEEHPLAGEASSSGEVITGASLFCKKNLLVSPEKSTCLLAPTTTLGVVVICEESTSTPWTRP